MARRKKRVNTAALIGISAFFVGSGCLTGFITARATTPYITVTEEVEVVKEVEVPVYVSSLPEINDIDYYDVPLSQSLQKYIVELCAEESISPTLILAMIEAESSFNPEAVSTSGSYGLMQINEINFEALSEEYHIADLLDSYQNVFCGIKIMSSYIRKYEDVELALMAYNMGEYGAQAAWESGIVSTAYTQKVLSLMSTY